MSSNDDRAKKLALVLDQHKVLETDDVYKTWYTKHKFDDDVSIQVVENLAKVGMTQTMIASIFGLSRRTFQRRLETDSQLHDAYHRGRAGVIGKAMNTAMAIAVSGIDPTTTRWFIERFGGAMESEAIAKDAEEEQNTIDVEAHSGPLTPNEIKQLVKEAYDQDPMLKEDDDADETIPSS